MSEYSRVAIPVRLASGPSRHRHIGEERVEAWLNEVWMGIWRCVVAEVVNGLAVVGGTDIAVEIGRLYRRAKEDWLEVGRLLKIQKDALDHGQWLPWLEDNREVLGFGESVAQRLMQVAANPQ